MRRGKTPLELFGFLVIAVLGVLAVLLVKRSDDARQQQWRAASQRRLVELFDPNIHTFEAETRVFAGSYDGKYYLYAGTGACPGDSPSSGCLNFWIHDSTGALVYEAHTTARSHGSEWMMEWDTGGRVWLRSDDVGILYWEQQDDAQWVRRQYNPDKSPPCPLANAVAGGGAP
jgi:hypothetical protein